MTLVIQSWSTFGMGVLIFLAGLSTVPKDMVEAARLEGAKMWQIWWHVIIPELRPIIEFSTVITTIGLLTSMFGLIYVLTGGGPGHGDDGARISDLVRAGPAQPARLRRGALDDPVCHDGRSRLAADPHHVAQRKSLRARVAGAGKRQRLALRIAAIPMGLLALSCLYPIFFAVNNALKTRHDYLLDRFGLAAEPDVRQLRAGLDALAPRSSISSIP